MRITDALRGEHASMRPFLRTIRGQTGLGETMDRAMVKCNANALKTMIKAHASVEEPYLLLPMGLRAQGPRTGLQAGYNTSPTDKSTASKAVAHALEEHREIDALLNRASQTGSQTVLNKAVKLILGHFEEEERDVFPAAEKMLSGARLSQLGADWAQARAIRI